MSDDKPFLYEKSGSIAYFTFNRPKKINAFDGEVYDLFEVALDDFEADRNLRCAVISGAGDNFSSGGDLKWWREMRIQAEQEGRQLRYHFNVFKALDRLRKPMVSAIDGWCVASGLNVGIFYSDVKIATTRARVQMPQVKHGISRGQNDSGYPHPWLSHTSLSNVLHIYLTARVFSAEEMQRMGLVNEVVPPEDLMTKATELAKTISENSPEHVAAFKEYFKRAAEVPGSFWLRLQHMAFRPLASQNWGEVTDAFLNKEEIKW